MTLTSITDYSTTKRKYIEDSDASPLSFFNFFLTTDAEQTSQEFRLDGETDNFNWVTGVYYLGLDLDDSNGVISDPFFGPVPTPGAEGGIQNPYTSNLDSYSIFGEIDYNLSDSMQLVLGARYIEDEKDFDYKSLIVEFINPDQRNYDAKSNVVELAEIVNYKSSRKDGEWSGRAVLNWDLNDDWMVYGSWNRGVRGGGYNAPIFPLTPPLDYDDATMSYDPEILYSYEIGFKSTIMDGLARLNGAVYYYDYQDYQAFYITGVDTITFNTDATSTGAELELQASPMEGLDLLLGASYNDIDVELPGGDVPSVVSPEWNLNAMLRYEWPMFGGYVAAQADAVYIDTVYFALTGAETVKQDGYTVANVSLSYTTEDRKWIARAFVDNVGDKEYLVQTFDLSSTDVLGMTEQYYGRPQWWGVSLQYNFGG